MPDYVAGRLYARKHDAANRIIDALKRKFGVVRVHDFLDKPMGSTGYRAIHVPVRLPDGMTAEVQIWPETFRGFADTQHRFYDLARSLKQEIRSDAIKALISAKRGCVEGSFRQRRQRMAEQKLNEMCYAAKQDDESQTAQPTQEERILKISERLRENLEQEAKKPLRYWGPPADVDGEIVRWVEFTDGDRSYQRWNDTTWEPTPLVCEMHGPADEEMLIGSNVPRADWTGNVPDGWYD